MADGQDRASIDNQDQSEAAHGDCDMTEGNIWSHLLNTADSVIVGKFVGRNALAAVGSTGSIINMLIGLCAGLSTGAGVVISQHYGARDYKKLRNAVHTTIIITFALSIL